MLGKSSQTLDAMERRVDYFDSHFLYLIQNRRDIEELKMIIRNGNLCDVKNYKGKTLLHYSAKYGNEEVLHYLIESGSRVDALDDRKRTPLMLIVNFNRREKVIETLIKAGANIYAAKKKGQSILQMFGQSDSPSKQALRPFFEKLQSDCDGDLEITAKMLFDAGWLLPKIVLLGNVNLTKIMLQKYYAADIDRTASRSLKTALHLAVEYADVKNVKTLLEYGANHNAVDLVNKKPLAYLYTQDSADDFNNNLEILKILLKKISTELIDARNLHSTLMNGNEEAIKLLFQYNINPMSAVDDSLKNLVVHLLAKNKSPGVIEQLKYQKFDINAHNKFEQTPLMIAAQLGNANTVEFLLNEGANINAVDFLGQNALFFLCKFYKGKEKQFRDCVISLLSRRANFQIEIFHYNMPRTMFDIILKAETFSIGELIIAHAALQEAQGISITEHIRSKIDSHRALKDFYELSKQQLKAHIIESITLYELLTATDKKVERYVCFQDFTVKFQEWISTLSNNYYFSIILQKRISKAKDVVILKHKAARAIGDIVKMSYKRFPHVIDKIIDDLEHQDMRNMIDASARENLVENRY